MLMYRIFVLDNEKFNEYIFTVIYKIFSIN